LTDSQQQTDTITQTQLAPPWSVIVHNDPITLMSYVTMAIQRIFGYDYAKAHGMMMEVHNIGRSVVWTGARERAEVFLHKLHAQQLLATMECTQE
jgi:ATP-dependent Clp protease adaptor protein ClpS